MVVYFGLELDDLVYPKLINQSYNAVVGHHYNGPKGLLFLLETHLGLSGHPNNIEHLRVEQFRQAIQLHLNFHKNPFYKASFEADQLATAAALLQRRDELLLAGWDFMIEEDTPNRLKTIAELESVTQSSDKESLSVGYSDRIVLAIKALEIRKTPIKQVFLNEPLALLPTHFQRLFAALKEQGVQIDLLKEQEIEGENDLAQFQKYLLNKSEGVKKLNLQADGSITLVKAKRETEAAAYLARIFKENSDFQPVCLIPEKNRALDNAFVNEGLPNLGIKSESLARPMLQILKLVSTFLWKPIDPYKIMEFVSLPVKPLPQHEVLLPVERRGGEQVFEKQTLASIISGEMAQTPGLGNARLEGKINQYFNKLQEEKEGKEYREARRQYDFWFKRKRYDIDKTVPTSEIIEIFDYLAKWSTKQYENGNSQQNSLLVLHSQASRISELLETLPDEDNELTFLQLERIVRTIYEPSPVVFKETEVASLPHVHHTSAIIQPIEQLLWWNFVISETPHFFSRWYQTEIKYLNKRAVYLQSPQEENAILLWQRIRPIIHSKKTIIFVVPEKVDGKEVQVHPLWSDLCAAFGDLKPITFDINTNEGKSYIKEKMNLKLPDNVLLTQKILGKPQPFLHVTEVDKWNERTEESYSSLEALFYYPYKWVFQYQIGLKKSSILSIVKENTLMGNLAHRLFELLLKEENVLTWNTTKVENWVLRRINFLLEREGAVLLMYGREPERMAFVNKLKLSAGMLLQIIRDNNWEIASTEKGLNGTFLDIEINGRADLELVNTKGEKAVIDLKWRGGARRARMIKNEEDLQLVMYSKLLDKDKTWAHTAFFIIESGKMIARNNLAFKEAQVITPDENHEEVNERIWKKMETTYAWRLKQLKEGKIEIRTKQTLIDIEEIMETSELFDLLEMKNENAPFDDFKTLINVLE